MADNFVFEDSLFFYLFVSKRDLEHITNQSHRTKLVLISTKL